VEPPAVLDRAAVRQGLAVQLGQVAVLQVALAERRVLQVPARLRVQRVLLLVQSQQWVPQLQAQVLWA
jgi:hypothetical protein